MLQYAPGDTVTLDVLRNGQQRQVEVTLGERPQE
jgi:S1-C subfamily serine protease